MQSLELSLPRTFFNFQIQMPLHTIPNFQHILSSFPLKNPPKTLLFLPKSFSVSTTTTTIMSSWSCSSCTFLNPPSQSSSCQICLTPIPPSPSPSSSSLQPSKWACKACTFLNLYNRSNCEICDTRSSLSSFEDLDPDPDPNGVSSVGSVFFPLRRCDTTKVQDYDGISDLGITEKGRKCGDFGGIELGMSRNFGYKRKFHDPGSETNNAVEFFNTIKKSEKVGTENGSVSTKITETANGSVGLKRKMRDLGDFLDKPMSGFCGVRSSGTEISDVDNDGGNAAAFASSSSVKVAENAEEKALGELKILSYNVWFQDVEVQKRMQAIGDLIQLHSPDVICLQEVTCGIYAILRCSPWWNKYSCSVSSEDAASQAYFCMLLSKRPVSFRTIPFSYTIMGRELSIAEIRAPGVEKSLVIATTHLESPCPGPPTWDQMYSKERVNQAKEAISYLQKYPNVIFCGDMNWNEKHDGNFPFAEGWFDAWEKMRPCEVGWTYDTKSNKMLSKNRTLQTRLDRFVCQLSDFDVRSIDMIGTEAIPGLTYINPKKVKGKIQEFTLPVFPSDHYGLLLTIYRK